MKLVRSLLAAPVVALLLAVPLARAERAEMPANTGTIKVDMAAREWLDVGLDVNGVTVDRLKLHPAGKMTSLVVEHDEANRGKVVITNGTDKRVFPGLAIAVFDDEGRLLAAANTGVRQRALQPGDTREFEIHLGGVFRHISRGKTLYLSLEY